MKRVILILLSISLSFAIGFAGFTYGFKYLREMGIPFFDDPLQHDYVLKNGLIVDGTGKPRYRADVGVKRGKISFIGIIEPPTYVKTIDASELLIMPGFIDLYSRLDGTAQRRDDYDGLLKQGITTILSGHGNLGDEDIYSHLIRASRTGFSLNYAVLAGQQGLFKLVTPPAPEPSDSEIGSDLPGISGKKPGEPPKPDLDTLLKELHKALEQGAFGLSINLGDGMGSRLSQQEVTELSKVLKERGALLSLTLPSTTPDALELVRRIHELQKGTGVRILNTPWIIPGNASVNTFEELVGSYKASYDETKNIYWAFSPERTQQLAMAQTLQRAYPRYPSHMLEIVEVGGQNSPAFVGRTLEEVANLQGTTPAAAARDLMANGLVKVNLRLNTLERIERLARAPYSVITVDSGIGENVDYSQTGLKNFLGKAVEVDKMFTWEEAALKMASRPAEMLGLENRGKVEVGQWADLVLIHPEYIIPKAGPKRTGIRYVFVNGKLVFSKGVMIPEGQGNGQLLRFKAKPIMPKEEDKPKEPVIPIDRDEVLEEG